MLVAEFLVDAFLNGGVVGAEATFAFFAVAVVAADHGVREGFNVDRRWLTHGRLTGGRLGRRGATEDFVDALLDCRVVGAEATFAFFPVAVLAVDDRPSKRINTPRGSRCWGWAWRGGVCSATGFADVGGEDFGGRIVVTWARGGRAVFVAEDREFPVALLDVIDEFTDGFPVRIRVPGVAFDSDGLLVVRPVPCMPGGVGFADHPGCFACFDYVVGGVVASPGGEPVHDSVEGGFLGGVIPVVDDDVLDLVPTPTFRVAGRSAVGEELIGHSVFLPDWLFGLVETRSPTSTRTRTVVGGLVFGGWGMGAEGLGIVGRQGVFVFGGVRHRPTRRLHFCFTGVFGAGEARERLLEFLGYGQAEAGGVFDEADAFVGDVEEDHRGSQHAAFFEDVDVEEVSEADEDEDEDFAADAFEADRAGNLMVHDGAGQAGYVVGDDEGEQGVEEAVPPA